MPSFVVSKCKVARNTIWIPEEYALKSLYQTFLVLQLSYATALHTHFSVRSASLKPGPGGG